MVIIFPAKKPKLEICDYKYCDGNHKISKCDTIKCDGTHTKSNKVTIGKNSPNRYLRYALSKSMEARFLEEKVQKQLAQNEEKLKQTNLYTSVSNLAEFEMEQENKQDEIIEENETDQYYDCDTSLKSSNTEVIQMKQYNPLKSLPLIRMLLILFYVL